ncbi:MAG: ribonuclease R [Alphaproteobacteria bacterium]|nr:ribonuclease R [Alphaproteobacteria bacterium]
MTKPKTSQKTPPLPSKSELLSWIKDNPSKNSKRDIARAFAIKGAAKIDLKHMLKQLADEGQLEKRKRNFRDPNSLPPVAVLRVLGPDKDGDLFAEPIDWRGENDAPSILVVAKKGDPALGKSDQILARLAAVSDQDYAYEARLIRKIGTAPMRILGLFRANAEGGRIVPIDKKSDREWLVPRGETMGAKDGELVEVAQLRPKGRMGLPQARVTEVLGDPSAPKSVSLYAIHAHGIPDAFPEEVLAEAAAAGPARAENREDLTRLPLVTIDPADARDHDDAIYAHVDEDPDNKGGFVVWVAIADVAYYVTPGSELDREARTRGNSTYFPDRVVPMLPDSLSGDLCSLHEGALRPCLAVRMVLDKTGEKISHSFTRGLMKSAASLTYEQAQAANDGKPDEQTAPLVTSVIAPLFAAYQAASLAREKRQPLHLDLPERKIVLSDDGQVTSVAFRERFAAHKLVEEFMILANVCAAETLETKRQPFLYRVHEEPSPEKLESLREVATAAGLALAKGQVLKTSHLNRLLDGAAGTEHAEIVNMSVLRSMTQAYYAPQNFGHFGLALLRYGHFTSPIRRYADLIIHRALITAHGWGEDGLSTQDVERLEETGTAISVTERRSMVAERDTNDRYLAAFLSERLGNEFEGRISGIARFGLFVRLNETGADGLVPISTLGREYFHHDPDAQTLTGERTGLTIKLGQPATVRLAEAAPITGGLMFELLSIGGKLLPRGGGRKSAGSRGRKQNVARKKHRKARKIEKRRPK